MNPGSATGAYSSLSGLTFICFLYIHIFIWKFINIIIWFSDNYPCFMLLEIKDLFIRVYSYKYVDGEISIE